MARYSDMRAEEPFKDWVAITPSDSVNIQFGSVDRAPDAVYVGGAGNIAMVDQRGGAAVTLTAVIVGQIYRIAPRRINATGTTATALVALYF